MKVCLSSLITLLGLTSLAAASILTEPKHAEPDRWLKIQEDVTGVINRVIAAKAGNFKIKVIPDGCPLYNPKEEATRLSVCFQKVDDASNSVSIQLRSPNNHFELEFSNIDVNDAASDIKLDPYFEEYIESLRDLALDDSARKTAIDEGIKAAATALSISDIAIAADKITYTYQNKANSIAYKSSGDLLEFSTDFFQDTIDLNIPLKKFITFEVKKMTREIIDHLFQMQRFALSDGDSAAQSIKILTCQKIMGDPEMTAAFTTRMADSKLTATFADTLTIAKADTPAQTITVSCAPISVGDFNLLEVTADFSAVAPNIQKVSQTYLEKSLYNLLPVSVAFFHDLGTFAIRVLADHNAEEEFEPVTVETAG